MPRSKQQQQEAQAQTSLLLATIWQRTLPLIEERLSLLDQAAAAALTGALPPDLRLKAHSTAHKLAGSLGMFGHTHAGEIAREIEQHLDPNAPLNPQNLTHQVAALRLSLPLDQNPV